MDCSSIWTGSCIGISHKVRPLQVKASGNTGSGIGRIAGDGHGEGLARGNCINTVELPVAGNVIDDAIVAGEAPALAERRFSRKAR